MIEVETKNASLDTLAVTIMALHVSGKQMTQAVFKQLPEGYEKEGEPIWGIVRYKGIHSNIWIIFSSDGILYRRELQTANPSLSWVREAQKELDMHDRKYSYNLPKTDNSDISKWAIEIAEKRLDIASDLEYCQSMYDEDLVKQQNEIALSKIQQLFIAV